MSDGGPLLVLRGLTKRFGGFAAVDDLSLEVAGGEFLTVLGASGSGKTTTLRLIAGFDQPTAGDILMAGVNLAGLPPYRRDVNTVFQQYALFPHLTVRENVGYGLRMRGVPSPERERRVADALAMVRLEGLEERKPRQLSGGQQQRVALARALVCRPRLLLLDEPLGALDLKLRKEMQLELKHLQRQAAIAFVYVTHDQEEALTMSDRIALMHRGRIEQLGTPDEIYRRPRSRYVADFIGETNLLPATLLGREGATVVLRVPGGTVRAPAPVTLSPGGSTCWLSVRPELVEVGPPDGGPSGNGLDGRVADVVFVGATVRLYVALPDGSRLVAHRSPGLPALAPGTPVRGAWAIEHGVVLGD